MMKTSIYKAVIPCAVLFTRLAVADPISDIFAATSVRFAPLTYQYDVTIDPFGINVAEGTNSVATCFAKPVGLEIAINPVDLGFAGLDVPVRFRGVRVDPVPGRPARIRWSAHEANLERPATLHAPDGSTHAAVVHGADGQFLTDVSERIPGEEESACSGVRVLETATMTAVGGDPENWVLLSLTVDGVSARAALSHISLIARARVPAPPPPEAGQLAALYFSPSSVCGGRTSVATLSIGLDHPAQGDYRIDLRNESGALIIPPAVTVPDRELSTSIQVSVPAATGVHTVVATSPRGDQRRASITVLRDAFSNGCRGLPRPVVGRPPPYIFPHGDPAWQRLSKVLPELSRVLTPQPVHGAAKH